MTKPMIPASRVATTRRTTQTVASMRRVWASRYIHNAPKTRATMPTRQMPRAKTSHSAPIIWNALAIGSQGHGLDAISSLLDVARVATHAREDGTFRVELSVFAPLTGVLLTLSLKPQCSHSIQIRVERQYQFHVGLPHRG